MKQIALLLLITVSTVSYAQVTASRKVVFYVSAQSTLDKSRRSDRAQFVGDNRLLNAYLGKELSELKYAGIDYNTTCEIAFRIDSTGNVDSLRLNRKSSLIGLDEKLQNVIKSTSGKWRVGVIDGKKSGEWNRIWIHLYSGSLEKKTLEEYIAEAKSLLAEGKYNKALAAIDRALNYDELNTEAVLLKGNILFKQGSKEEACSIWRAFSNYNNMEAAEQLKNNCK